MRQTESKTAMFLAQNTQQQDEGEMLSLSPFPASSAEKSLKYIARVNEEKYRALEHLEQEREAQVRLLKAQLDHLVRLHQEQEKASIRSQIYHLKGQLEAELDAATLRQRLLMEAAAAAEEASKIMIEKQEIGTASSRATIVIPNKKTDISPYYSNNYTAATTTATTTTTTTTTALPEKKKPGLQLQKKLQQQQQLANEPSKQTPIPQPNTKRGRLSSMPFFAVKKETTADADNNADFDSSLPIKATAATTKPALLTILAKGKTKNVVDPKPATILPEAPLPRTTTTTTTKSSSSSSAAAYQSGFLFQPLPSLSSKTSKPNTTAAMATNTTTTTSSSSLSFAAYQSGFFFQPKTSPNAAAR